MQQEMSSTTDGKTDPGPPTWLLRLLVLIPLAAAIAGCLFWSGRQGWAWYQFRSGNSALSHHQAFQAIAHLKSCLAIWPQHTPARLLLARASRQTGDFQAANEQLFLARRDSEQSSEEMAFEWALLQAASGNTREVDDYLQRQVEREPSRAPLVWEALAEGYIRLYRVLDAVAALDFWLDREPENVRALELRGLAFQNGRQSRKAADDYRKVLNAQPGRDEIRRNLVLCLLDTGGYEEALRNLELLLSASPEDSDLLVRAARCQALIGQPASARQILQEVLRRNPDHALALRTMGQLEMGANQPALAETWLARALPLLPDDYQAHWLFLRSLQQQGKNEQARAFLSVAEKVKDRAERLGELTSRKLSEQPLDPALHHEMGVLLLQGGNQTAGETWLLSAINLDPQYAPAHRALAEHYARKGDRNREAEHRRLGEREPQRGDQKPTP